MTDTDEPPDLSVLDEGDDARIYYRSQRSGNEVDRRGEVAFRIVPEDSQPLTYVHTEQRGPLKHQYVALVEAELENGDDAVAAYSVTVEADPPNDGDPPKPGRTFTVQFTVGHTSLLGVVDRVMKNGVNVNYV